MTPYRIPAMAGKPYTPSNGDEGMRFEAAFCDRCQRDAEWNESYTNPCAIHNAGLAGQRPTEWAHDDGGEPTCTAFESMEPREHPGQGRLIP